MLYQCDLKQEMLLFQDKYSAILHSDDLLDLELPLTKLRLKGGTMVLWKHEFDPFIAKCPCISSSFCSVVLSLPGSAPSIHTTIYLPTAGRDDDFIEESVKLYDHLLDLTSKYM